MNFQLSTYLLEAVVCQVVFYIFYRIFLQNETFFGANRAYLLLSLVISLITPIVDIPLRVEKISSQYFFASQTFASDIVAVQPDNSLFLGLAFEEIALRIYWLICCVLLLKFIYQISKLLLLSRKFNSSTTAHYQLILTDGQLPTFSFFRLLFFNNHICLTEREKLQMLTHEITHIKQWHSLDILFVELLKVFFWFNPILYLFKKALQQVHEYQADAMVVQQHETSGYIEVIIAQLFHTSSLPLTNPFEGPTIKNRILMIEKNKTHKPAFWKLFLSLPLIGALFLMYACQREVAIGINPVYGVVDTEGMPIPIGGWQAMKEKIANEIKYPLKAQANKIEGYVFVDFLINRNGSVSNAKVRQGLGYGLDEAAIAAISTIQWHPARDWHGRLVDFNMSTPIAFALTEEKKAEMSTNTSLKIQSLIEYENRKKDSKK